MVKRERSLLFITLIVGVSGITTAQTVEYNNNNNIENKSNTQEVRTYSWLPATSEIIIKECKSGPINSNSLFSIKTDAVYGLVTYTPNISIETGISNYGSIEFTIGWNPFRKNDLDKHQHIQLKLEGRYWFDECRNRHYLGISPFYADYDISNRTFFSIFDKKYRYDGNVLGLSLSYGYRWMYNEHMGLEFSVGFGIAAFNYDKYNAVEEADVLSNFRKTYFGLSALSIKWVYRL